MVADKSKAINNRPEGTQGESDGENLTMEVGLNLQSKGQA